jgi:hypothetical protein
MKTVRLLLLVIIILTWSSQSSINSLSFPPSTPFGWFCVEIGFQFGTRVDFSLYVDFSLDYCGIVHSPSRMHLLVGIGL